jgi:Fe-S-cluster containining protein
VSLRYNEAGTSALSLRFDPELRFTCRHCARCCQCGWVIALTMEEVERYRKAQAGRWFRESAAAAEGTKRDPFEAVAGHGDVFRIRRRDDGACGFLSAENRCRIHEELGGDQKPLTCRLFPFSFHATGNETVVTSSFSCPTIASQQGATLASQAAALNALQREWSPPSAGKPAAVMFDEGVGIAPGTAAEYRSILRRILDRRRPDGSCDLCENVARIALYCEDLTRRRVLRLPADGFAEYMSLTGRHAAFSDRPVSRRPPSRLARVYQRGFLFSVIAMRMKLEDRQPSRLHLGLRWRVLRVLAHLHGIGPPYDYVDLPSSRKVTFPHNDPEIAEILYNYLRAAIAALGTGRYPLIRELGLSIAQLNAACALAAMHAARVGAATVTAETLIQGLTEAADLAHAQMDSALGGTVESLFQFAAGGSTT